jgi:hypothetical protein
MSQELERLTRRHFLGHLKLLSVGAGAAIVLGTRPADAHIEVAALQSAKPVGPVTDKPSPAAEAIDGDSGDPVERVQYRRRRRRRFWRRTRRRRRRRRILVR